MKSEYETCPKIPNYSPSFLLIIICLMSSKDFFLVMYDLLPRKFRGLADDLSFSALANYELAVLAVFPMYTLLGIGKFRFTRIYQKTIFLQISSLIALSTWHIFRSAEIVITTPFRDNSLEIINIVMFIYFGALLLTKRVNLFKLT